MSNTSYSFKENSHAIVNQGGEKKVMKKILSVALSTAMAFSMFASVAFGADSKLSPEAQFNVLKDAGIVTGYPDGTAGLDKFITRAELAKVIVKSINLDPVDTTSYNDKNYAKHWARTYIEAATQKGILEGKNAEKKLFDPSGNVTVQELAAVLVRALKLEVPTETNNSAADWAKGYVQAAINGGYLAEGINYQANATRSQAVVAAYAFYEANQVPTVSKYEVKDSKNVEFTMSDGEVVKVALEKALEANKETEVKFTYKDKEYTHKVTYVTTVAQKVESVKSEALKQIVVTFDGSVDAATAGSEDNYVIKDIEFRSATLSNDKKSVTLLIDKDSSALINQREVELEIKNVKNEDATKTFNEKVKFTPIDVTAPTVKEVVGLGTKAFKVKFSEPIQSAVASSSFRVDGKAIGANVKFQYPDTVIVQTNLTVGEHTVTVENVKDFAGLAVAAVNNSFTVAEDTTAPSVVSATSKDLKEVTVEFDETIKSVSEAYANSSSHKASKIEIEDNKVILTFKDAINYTENTITLKGVSDYSNNKADREVKVTPSLDTVRPTVVETKIEIDSLGRYVAKIRFSEKLHEDSLKKDNFVLKNSEGKIADVSGVNSNSGNPHITPTFANTKNTEISVNLGYGLKSEKYTLTISNVKDNAAVPNLIIPVTVDLDISKAQNGEINRVWVEKYSNDSYNYIIVEFNKELSTSGEGDATSPAKYFLYKDDAKIGQLTDKENEVELLTSKSVRIKVTNSTITKDYNRDDLVNPANKFKIVASYIKNSEGEYLKNGNSYELVKEITDGTVTIKDNKAKAISTDEIKVEFNSALNTLVDSDFYAKVGTTTYSVTGTLAGDGKSATFKLDKKFTADAADVKFGTKSGTLASQNEFGAPLKNFVGNEVTVDDEIKPELKGDSVAVAVTGSATTATYTFTLTATEKVKFNTEKFDFADFQTSDAVKGLWEVKANTSNNVEYSGTVKQVIVSGADDKVQLVVEFKLNNTVVELPRNAQVVIKLKAENNDGKYIIDVAKNALKADNTSIVLN
ncbi:S-layer homology domain-containing protein [Fontibacillus panacisegetis]|uniref:S-layer homology domain-containing protein n=1 Tax=Fontibacillus panacisegetis TaxID=670482 RepID=A0A1G7PM26_9BACL|nr:S-layer homology domain-containing protein [Fontibacillus panacisegetis]SDF87283.1 S-layer homology domain-containing protein [Fontibacillus panacisegetis]